MDETKINPEDIEDTLSLCDLPLHEQQPQSSSFHQLSHTQEDPFHFLFDHKAAFNNHPNIMFCGKIIKDQDQDQEEDDTFEPLEDQRSYLFPLSSARLLNGQSNKIDITTGNNSYSSPREMKSKVSSPPRATEAGNFKSSSSRKHKVLIGLARIPPRMELSDIKKRQSRQNPAPMFSAVATAVETEKIGGFHRGLLKTLRCRDHLAGALAKASLGCMRHV